MNIVAALLVTIALVQEPAPLTNKDIVTLVRSGLSSALIIAKIGASPGEFDTSPDALKQLKADSIPDEVVLAMIQPKSAPPARVRVRDELSTYFQTLQNAVVTVWSETGHGTGFIVDSTGLVLTNRHVVGNSTYLAVQLDATRKLPATRVAEDPAKDVAVLRIGLEALPDAVIAPIASDLPGVEEGERVFTIGSPLSQRKIMTTGIASKVEARAVLSDININHGNSGGPLFNSLGEVVGITTFGEPDGAGPGISGIIRIEEALPLLSQAKNVVSRMGRPDTTRLPIEPSDPFPLEAIKTAATLEKLDTKPYVFGAGDFDVGIITPLLRYRVDQASREAAKSKEKRTKNKDAEFDPTEDLYNWAEYIGEYRAVVTIRATPKLRETFWSAVGRGLAAQNGRYAGPANMKFKTDFLRMELLCAGRPVRPIHPGKISQILDVRNSSVNAVDATYQGLYVYPVEAFDPHCIPITLRLYSEKNPQEVTLKTLDQKTVYRVWNDFDAWRRQPN